MIVTTDINNSPWYLIKNNKKCIYFPKVIELLLRKNRLNIAKFKKSIKIISSKKLNQYENGKPALELSGAYNKKLTLQDLQKENLEYLSDHGYKIIIVTDERSGGTTFCNILNVLFDYNIAVIQDPLSFPEYSYDQTFKIFSQFQACKVSLITLKNYTQIKEMIDSLKNTKIIILERLNEMERVLSKCIAQSAHVWDNYSQKNQIDYSQIIINMNDIKLNDSRDKFFYLKEYLQLGQIDYYYVTYEELFDQKEMDVKLIKIKELCSFLNIPFNVKDQLLFFLDSNKKVNDKNKFNHIKNIAEVYQYFDI
jgi:hypothetical protein